VVSRDIVHKSDIGGVLLGVAPADAAAGFSKLLRTVADAAPAAKLDGILVEAMVPAGREAIVGGHRDPSFGPTVMFGLGGVLVEVFRDVVFRLAPIARPVAAEMIRGIRAASLFAGVRGAPPIDYRAVEDVLLRVSQLLVDCPAVVELDLNPVVVTERGAVVADARVMVQSMTAPTH